ncbi:hypothetical protein E2C01_084674 [Portunus trituberculatus]|uniref:Uncharacterized protein n=1 Tax=Portunus trituberculatus TaxID=210409 RepID=A0A5B7J6V9_PORTR|nr:hypothetical protein [Portunus trituberculatus]
MEVGRVESGRRKLGCGGRERRMAAKRVKRREGIQCGELRRKRRLELSGNDGVDASGDGARRRSGGMHKSKISRLTLCGIPKVCVLRTNARALLSLGAFLPSFLPSFLPFFLPSSLPACLPALLLPCQTRFYSDFFGNSIFRFLL